MFQRKYLILATAVFAMASGSQLLANQSGDTKSGADIEKGQAVYEVNCAVCHGSDGKAQTNLMGSAADLTDPQYFRNGGSLDEITSSIEDGVGNGMPAWKTQLSSDEIKNVSAFVYSMRE